MRNVQIGEDGTIFRIKEDGTIHKIAKIDDNYRIVGEQSGTAESHNPLPWMLLAIAVIVCVIIGVNLNSTSSRLSYAQYELQNAESNLLTEKDKVSGLGNDIKSLRESLNTIGAKYPIIITDIQIANTDSEGGIETNYGSTLYSSYTMYLTPKITYKTISNGNITLYIKLYRPNGDLSTGTSSPSGYSFSSSINPSGDSYDVLSGWGSGSKGNWSSGTYRIEVWYKGTCLNTKSFTIY